MEVVIVPRAQCRRGCFAACQLCALANISERRKKNRTVGLPSTKEPQPKETAPLML